MQELTQQQIDDVSGGLKFKINLGHWVSALAVGFVTGGPAGVGIVLCGAVVMHGVNKTSELYP